MEVLCSTGAIIGKANHRDYRLLEPLSGQLSCDGFEFMMYGSWYDETKALLHTLTRFGLYIPVMHCEKHVGEYISKGGEENLAEAYRLFELNCQIANALSAKKMVIHLWDGLTSDAHFQNNQDAFPYLNDTAEKYGVLLLVENVVCNHEDPLRHWCTLKDVYPDIRFVFDTKMAAFHAQLELLYQPEYRWLWQEKHICHYHVNDYAGGYKDWNNLRTLPIGSGDIDFEKFFRFIAKTRYRETFTVESTAIAKDGTVDTDILNRQFQYIREALSRSDATSPSIAYQI